MSRSQLVRTRLGEWARTFIAAWLLLALMLGVVTIAAVLVRGLR